MFDDLFGDRVGELNDFEAVDFYSDFTRMMSNRIMIPSMQEQLLGYFQITSVPDPAIDLVCAEASKQTSTDTNTSSPTKPKKRTKHYNKPIISVACVNCDETDLRFMLIKKLTTCKADDVYKFHQFWVNLKAENVLISALPPIAERDVQLQQEMSSASKPNGH